MNLPVAAAVRGENRAEHAVQASQKRAEATSGTSVSHRPNGATQYEAESLADMLVATARSGGPFSGVWSPILERMAAEIGR
jgi:hypothetical protein